MKLQETLLAVTDLLLGQVRQVPENKVGDLFVAIDDSLDVMFGKLIEAKYGVEVIPNVDGDRSKISIDGQVMNQIQFANWLAEKESEEDQPEYEDEEDDGPTNRLRFEEQLPETLLVNTGGCIDISVLKTWLRKQYGHCLARGCDLDAEPTGSGQGIWKVTNITWGRKLTQAERDAIVATENYTTADCQA